MLITWQDYNPEIFSKKELDYSRRIMTKVLQKFFIKSVVVTGANRGIGLELVRYFAKQNKLDGVSKTKVISCSRRMSPELEELLEEVHHVELEVTDSKSLENAVSKVSTIVGDEGLNLLINNAAIMRHGKGSLGCTEAELTETLNVNVTGIHSVTRKFHPLLKMGAAFQKHIPHSCARAAVLNISSELGSIQNTKNSFTTAYRVSKAAVNMLTKCASHDLVKDDIICLSVHPGWVRTDLGGPQAPLSAEESVADIVEMIEQFTKEHNGMFVRKGLVAEPY